MPAVRLQVARYLDDYQPGLVECWLEDVIGVRRSFAVKAPYVTDRDSDWTSPYPFEGSLGCVIRREFPSDTGERLIEISTAEPLAIEATDGTSVFTVRSDQIIG